MGVLFDYFIAPSDQAAAETLHRVGGPASTEIVLPEPPPPPKRGFFRRSAVETPAPEPVVVPELPVVAFDTVSMKGIDPVVQLGELEELLTGVSYDDVVTDPRAGGELASWEGGSLMVLTLTDRLQAGLADLPAERIPEVAGRWAESEEWFGDADPEHLASVVADLAGLARRGRESGQGMYCWVCV